MSDHSLCFGATCRVPGAGTSACSLPALGCRHHRMVRRVSGVLGLRHTCRMAECSCWHQSHVTAELTLFACDTTPPLVTVFADLCPVLAGGEVAAQPIVGGVSVGCPVVRHAGQDGQTVIV